MHTDERAHFDTMWLASGLEKASAKLARGATITPRLGDALARGETLDQALAHTMASPAEALIAKPGPGTPASLPRITLVTDGALPGEPSDSAARDEDRSELRVVGVLGEGGMGRVLLARQRSLARDVAVKVLRPEALGHAGVTALLAEARLTGSLEHPNVVPVHALGRDERGHPVLVMKRVEGVPWRELLSDAAHPAWSAIAPESTGVDRLHAHLEILMDVCNALEFAHARGVIHRDLKPDNVLIGSFGEVYVADWGIALERAAVAKNEGTHGAERRNALVGTPGYLAPEMCSGDPARVDARTDVFLLGATLHEVLTGTYRHEGATVYEVLVRALECARVTYAPSVPAELGEIANRATARAPSERFASAREFRAAIASYLLHRSSVALADSARARLTELRVLVAGDARALDPVQVSRLGTECRFAFTQALREWPENPTARAGLRDALTLLAAYELDRDQLDAGRALLHELGGDVSEALRAKLSEAERRHDEVRARQKSLEKLDHELDLRVSSRERTRVFVILSVLSGAIGLGAIALSRRPDGSNALSWRGSFILSGVVMAFAFAAVLLARRFRLRTTVNRRLLSLLLIGSTALTANRVIAYSQGRSVSDALVTDMLVIALTATCAPALISPVLWPSAAWALGCTAALALRWVDPVSGFSVGTLGVFVVLAVQLGRVGTRDDADGANTGRG